MFTVNLTPKAVKDEKQKSMTPDTSFVNLRYDELIEIIEKHFRGEHTGHNIVIETPGQMWVLQEVYQRPYPVTVDYYISQMINRMKWAEGTQILFAKDFLAAKGTVFENIFGYDDFNRKDQWNKAPTGEALLYRLVFPQE